MFYVFVLCFVYFDVTANKITLVVALIYYLKGLIHCSVSTLFAIKTKGNSCAKFYLLIESKFLHKYIVQLLLSFYVP